MNTLRRPAISDVLLKAVSNTTFRTWLLTDPHKALSEMKLPPEDFNILVSIQANSFYEFIRQVRIKL